MVLCAHPATVQQLQGNGSDPHIRDQRCIIFICFDSYHKLCREVTEAPALPS